MCDKDLMIWEMFSKYVKESKRKEKGDILTAYTLMYTLITNSTDIYDRPEPNGQCLWRKCLVGYEPHTQAVGSKNIEMMWCNSVKFLTYQRYGCWSNWLLTLLPFQLLLGFSSNDKYWVLYYWSLPNYSANVIACSVACHWIDRSKLPLGNCHFVEALRGGDFWHLQKLHD